MNIRFKRSKTGDVGCIARMMPLSCSLTGTVEDSKAKACSSGSTLEEDRNLKGSCLLNSQKRSTPHAQTSLAKGKKMPAEEEKYEGKSETEPTNYSRSVFDSFIMITS